ncbi:MAG: haloacid dehalogenase-like hydrolase [Oscillospiraceae bacterium]|nr:haloacid dehalogenase-like hydrolase [Oscillospiraceae bacterium]
MEKKMYERKHKEDKPVLAICYDFDKTLSPDDMQAQGFIQSVGYDVGTFWDESNALAEKNDMDQNLAYMLKMLEAAEGRRLFTKDELLKCGKDVELFPGVESWFDRIKEYGDQKGIIVEHYVISCGLKEMIEGTSVADKFEKIYACSFYYNEKGVAKWPAQVINYTGKTQFLFRIEKGVLDVNDQGVNESFAPENMRVPFRNMVYIGDSDTDVPCMKLVNSYGGHSIGVYHTQTLDKTKVYKMMREGRIKFFAPADYSEGSELDNLVKSIIDRTAANEKLEDIHYQCKKENIEADKLNDEEEMKKIDLLIALEDSGSFARTHKLIEEMQAIKKWTTEDCEKLFKIAVSNTQVFFILGDTDLRAFFSKLLKKQKDLSENAQIVKAAIEDVQ